MAKSKTSGYFRLILLTAGLLTAGIASAVCARDTIPEANRAQSSNDTIPHADTIPAGFPEATDDSVLREEPPSTDDSVATPPPGVLPQEDGGRIAARDATAFRPDPKTAYLFAAIFPGFGQVYNRQYWKLPIVYGGLVGFMYAITWNNKMYRDYKRAYFDIRTDYNHYRENPDLYGPDTWNTSWQDFTNMSPAAAIMDSNFHSRLQKGRDYFRRYRDLSIILSVAFYFICIADAYVDAQMFDFDVSPDLSFRVAPEFHPSTLTGSRSFGLTICMTF
jgi:hypothetical protein